MYVLMSLDLYVSFEVFGEDFCNSKFYIKWLSNDQTSIKLVIIWSSYFLLALFGGSRKTYFFRKPFFHKLHNFLHILLPLLCSWCFIDDVSNKASNVLLIHTFWWSFNPDIDFRCLEHTSHLKFLLVIAASLRGLYELTHFQRNTIFIASIRRRIWCWWEYFFVSIFRQLSGKKTISKWMLTGKQSTPNFPGKRTFLTPCTHTYVSVSRGKKCSFSRKLAVLCLLLTPILRFALLLYC